MIAYSRLCKSPTVLRWLLAFVIFLSASSCASGLRGVNHPEVSQADSIRLLFQIDSDGVRYLRQQPANSSVALRRDEEKNVLLYEVSSGTGEVVKRGILSDPLSESREIYYFAKGPSTKRIPPPESAVFDIVVPGRQVPVRIRFWRIENFKVVVNTRAGEKLIADIEIGSR